MAKLEDLNIEQLQTKRKQLALTQMGIASVGTVAGWIYANKTGGGFWRYVGFGIMGGIAAGSIGYFTTYQRIAKIETLIGTNK